MWDPEFYPRKEEVYVCGERRETPLPEEQSEAVQPESDAIEKLKKGSAMLSSKLEKGKVLNESSCYLPCSVDGPPIVGEIPGTNSTAFLATAASCWGILEGTSSLSCFAFLCSLTMDTVPSRAGDWAGSERVGS